MDSYITVINKVSATKKRKCPSPIVFCIFDVLLKNYANAESVRHRFEIFFHFSALFSLVSCTIVVCVRRIPSTQTETMGKVIMGKSSSMHATMLCCCRITFRSFRFFYYGTFSHN